MTQPVDITVQPSPEVTHFRTSMQLDGRRYSFRFYTNKDANRWYFDCTAGDESEGVRGQMLRLGVDMLHLYRYLDVPPGPLYVKDLSLTGEDPDLTSFTEGRHALYYLPVT